MKGAFITAAALTALSLSACTTPVAVGSADTKAIVVPVPVGVPVLVKENNNDNSIHSCKIRPFTKTYQSEHTNRGKARLDVLKQCKTNHHEMFCREKDIECSEYK